MGKFSKEFVRGSIILFLSFNVFNFLNLIFNFVSARLLGPADYGTLAALMGLVFLFSIPNETIQTVVSRYTTTFNVKKNKKKLKGLLTRGIGYFLKIALILFLIFSAVSFLILQHVLSIEWTLLVLTGVFIFGALLVPITRGILQGTKKFNSLGWTYISESVTKLLLAVALILLGWKVYGAITGVVFGILISFALSFISLKDILKLKGGEIKIKEVTPLASLISIASIMIFFTLDIIFAKAFFSDEMVGYYAAVSNLGKVIFLGTWGISRAMFPLASEKHDKKENSKGLLEQTFILVFLASLVILAVYMIFNEQIITLLYGSQYSKVSGLLIYPSFAMAILSIANVFVLYNLCIKKPKRNYITILAVAVQITLFSIFHSTLMEFSIALIVSNLFLLISVILTSLKK